MATPAAGDPDEQTAFNPKVKCCTYLPELPNFLVGMALADMGEDALLGRTSLTHRIQRGIAVSPLGLGGEASYSLVYEAGKNLFGQSTELLCPHYVDSGGGHCGIWRYRNAVCATWFCKHERGQVGRSFWSDVKAVFGFAEQELAVWCVLQSDLDVDAVHKTLGELRPSTGVRLEREHLKSKRAAHYSTIWKNYLGREEEFYRTCAARVEALSWAEVLRIGGPMLDARSQIVRRAYEHLTSFQRPHRLRMADVSARRMQEAFVRVSTYSVTDQLLLQRELLDVLAEFDGRPADLVFRELEENGITLQDDLVRRLVDFGVLEDSRPGNMPPAVNIGEQAIGSVRAQCP
jgi:hypothetical protein